jgi:hypothetical protein
MDNRSTQNGSTRELLAAWWHRIHSLYGRQRFRRVVVHGSDVRQLAVECVQGTDYAVTEPYRAPHNCVEDRLHVGRGARYHSQDFAGRRLLSCGQTAA